VPPFIRILTSARTVTHGIGGYCVSVVGKKRKKKKKEKQSKQHKVQEEETAKVAVILPFKESLF
jgi:hypothetical protein